MLKQAFVFLSVILGFGLAKLQNDGNTKIVGGKEFAIEDANFIVLIMYDNRQLCGASIIAHNWLLSAGHCIFDTQTNHYTIRSGSNKIGDGDLSYVSQIVVHPQYDESNFDFDFSLLKIYGRIFYNERQRPIHLPNEFDEIAEGEPVRTLGWGDTLNPKESNKYLRGVDLVTISASQCEKAYESFRIKVVQNKICAIHPEKIDGKDACQGDSGGPLIRLSNNELIGVVSFGQGCAKAKYPGVYARVSSVRSWIKSVSGV